MTLVNKPKCKWKKCSTFYRAPNYVSVWHGGDGAWCAQANGILQYRGGFQSMSAAMEWVEANAVWDDDPYQ